MPAPVTAALLLIGNELLSGKIVDQNGQLAIATLRRRGIDLIEVRIVADDEAAIGAAARELAARATFVITSGGIGPTHDDITLASIAAGAFLHTTSLGQISPLPFFIFPVLAAGWFFGWKQICLFSLLSASAWTLGPKLTFSAQLPLHWIAWNLLSRTSVLLILGLFAWHLKATLLSHQNQKE